MPFRVGWTQAETDRSVSEAEPTRRPWTSQNKFELYPYLDLSKKSWDKLAQPGFLWHILEAGKCLKAGKSESSKPEFPAFNLLGGIFFGFQDQFRGALFFEAEGANFCGRINQPILLATLVLFGAELEPALFGAELEPASARWIILSFSAL
jgi:hypothetical protein